MTLQPWQKAVEEAGSSVLLALGIGAVCIFGYDAHTQTNGWEIDPFSFSFGVAGLLGLGLLHLILLKIAYDRLIVAADLVAAHGHVVVGKITGWMALPMVAAVDFQLIGVINGLTE